MAENKEKHLRRLISLLDDPDEESALMVLSELLSREEEIDLELLAEYQESSSKCMRRRIHQLQSALIQRRRRHDFLRRLKDPEVDFFELLLDVHLQWFDNDSRPAVKERLDAFLTCARRNKLSTLEEIAIFMLGSGITAEKDGTLNPELYCIGSVIQECQGAVSLLAATVCHLNENTAKMSVGKVLDEFCLKDPDGRILLPGRSWQIFPAGSLPDFTPWESRKILKLASANLFSSAVNSDSLRYILTISQTLSGLRDDSVLQMLPYPYNISPDEEE